MNELADLPLWAGGAGRAASSSLGAAIDPDRRLRPAAASSTFYERVHAPTLGTSFGRGLHPARLDRSISASLRGRPVLHEVLIVVFVTVTTPVTLMLLARAALYRDRVETALGQRPTATSEAGPAAVNEDGKPRAT